METTGDRPEGHGPAQNLRELERAEALPYVVYPPTLWWQVALQSLFLTVVVLFFGSSYGDGFLAGRDTAGRILFVVAALGVAILFGVMIGLVRQRYRAYPKPPYVRTAPREIRELYWRGYLPGLVVVAGLVALTWWWAGMFAAAAATFVLASAGLALYERRYAHLAAVVRERLRIEAA